jgi:hypothetical protein
MIRHIAPLFFARDIPRTFAYYEQKLGFQCSGTWQGPPVYAIVARDEHAIHFRCAAPPTANPDKYSDAARQRKGEHGLTTLLEKSIQFMSSLRGWD